MSFILDALKKSETERQQQGAAEFSAVPVSTDKPGAPKWLWILGLLLAINIVVLIGILIRSNTPSPAIVTSEPITADRLPDRSSATAPEPTQSATAEPNIAETALAEPTFAEQVIAAKEKQTKRGSEQSSASRQPQPEASAVQSKPPEPSLYLPTFDEARVRGLFQMTDLHLDIHVFGETPSDRFVFINMVKHREDSQLASGPMVREITPDGVILEYQGTTFLLPRE